jgi:histidinol dehydrogenase
MIKILEFNQDDTADYTQRPEFEKRNLTSLVKGIFEVVKADGDSALRKYNAQFDGCEVEELLVSQKELEDAFNSLDGELLKAILVAKENITRFHQAQKFEELRIETSEGVTCFQKAVPIEKVGLYIPGGTAPLFSTILMLSIPAQIAGCREVILCSPPNNDGGINKIILGVAHLCGIQKVYNVGGAQAIAAMTLGTNSITKVDKIFGPGNQFVTAAKAMAVEYGAAIDMPAGPSEVLVYGDHTANPSFIASDLLSQAEHGVDSHAVAVVMTIDMAEKIQQELALQTSILPRKEMAEETFKNSYILVCPDVDVAFDFINQYAPEHLIIASHAPDQYIPYIINAGSVFLGNYTPESAGDYASGTNHTLPTHGWARSYSGVNLDTFTKKITFQSITEKGIAALGPTIIKMAEEEQLEAHANAVRLRINSLK